jgi:hypothetical protein
MPGVAGGGRRAADHVHGEADAGEADERPHRHDGDHRHDDAPVHPGRAEGVEPDLGEDPPALGKLVASGSRQNDEAPKIR